MLDENAEAMSALVEVALGLAERGVVVEVPAGGAVHPPSPAATARDVVRLGVARLDDATLLLHVAVADGYHLYAADASGGVTPTRLEMPGAKVEYPPGETLSSPGADRPVAAYAGTFSLTVRFATAPTGVVRGTLTYQACSDSACLPVVTVPIEIRPEGEHS
jgi:thiol:disulfide interchange protein